MITKTATLLGLPLLAAAVLMTWFTVSVLAADSEPRPSQEDSVAGIVVTEAHGIDDVLAELADEERPCQTSCERHDPSEALWILRFRCEKAGDISFEGVSGSPKPSYQDLLARLTATCQTVRDSAPDAWSEADQPWAQEARAGLRDAINLVLQDLAR